MAIESITSNINQRHSMTNFLANRREISYGHINLKKSEETKNNGKDITIKDKVLATVGSVTGVMIPLITFMKMQKRLISLKLNIKCSIC